MPLPEDPIALLREARRDWIKDTWWDCDQYGGVEVPTGEAMRAFGARIDAALKEDDRRFGQPNHGHDGG
jgi:hypothetical protein